MIGLQEGSYSFSALDCLFCSKLSKCHSVILLIVFHPSLSLSSFSSTGWWYECYHSANIFLFCRCSFLRYSVSFGHLPANTGNMRFFAALVHSLLFVMLFPHATSLFPFSVSSFFLCNLLQTGLACILILCVFFGQSGTKGFCFPASAFTPHGGCGPLS